MGFPYIFRGALDVHATTINEEMKIAAADAIAKLAREWSQIIPENKLSIRAIIDNNMQFEIAKLLINNGATLIASTFRGVIVSIIVNCKHNSMNLRRFILFIN